jgi:hypothetical protein
MSIACDKSSSLFLEARSVAGTVDALEGTKSVGIAACAFVDEMILHVRYSTDLYSML